MSTKLAILTAATVLAGTAATTLASDRSGGFHGDGPGKRFWKEADSNSDGTITTEEMVAAVSARFKEADGNADAAITRAELLVAVENRANDGRTKRHAGMFADGLVLRLDINEDGKVTLTEVENRARKHFALADFNDDGKVEREEIARMMPHRGGFRHKARWGMGSDMPDSPEAE